MTISYWETARTRFEASVRGATPVGEVLEAIENMENTWVSMYGSDASTEAGKELSRGTAVTLQTDPDDSNNLLVGFNAWTSGHGFDPKESSEESNG